MRWLATERRTYSLGSRYRASRSGTVTPGWAVIPGTRTAHGRYGRVPSLARRLTCSSAESVHPVMISSPRGRS
ncbi:hypothetical protein ACFFX0_19130 [Citricoccus parietis]|uniref:Uncharacterized protein n=1 Tax=Citricoccus parietis TaxID=592307 RepID=A0ABV5G2P3_9MICC